MPNSLTSLVHRAGCLPAPAGQRARAGEASAIVKRPARSALPATAASQPSSCTATRSSIEEIPPAAITGSPMRTSARRSTSGPGATRL